ncbi:hypothetical protein BS17DRAFT_770716 [Gyrodon lividus]|nr:hypothetical protein BS17DRAFT_770716 [Gyrodon lividus]
MSKTNCQPDYVIFKQSLSLPPLSRLKDDQSLSFMTPQKCKWSKAVGSKASLPPKKLPGAKKKSVVCSHCCLQKVKYNVPDRHFACSRCTASGPQVAGECDVMENHGSTHGFSAPPVNPPPANPTKPASQRPTPQHAPTKKTSPSMNIADLLPPNSCKPAAMSPLLTANLNAIPEIDEPYNPPVFGEPTYDSIKSIHNTDVSTSQPHSLEHANAFFDAVTAGLPCDSDGYVSKKSETCDLNAVSSNRDNVDGSKGSDDESDLEMQQLIVIARCPNIKAHTTKPKAATAQHPKTSCTSDKAEPPIQCIACQPNGSNAPFEIPSTISLEELHSKVGRKMEQLPDLIQLQYHLEFNRAWQGATENASYDHSWTYQNPPFILQMLQWIAAMKVWLIQKMAARLQDYHLEQ